MNRSIFSCRELVISGARFFSTRQSGTVKFFIRKKAYGFIVPDNGGGDVFVHRSSIVSTQEDLMHPFLREGERVSFEISSTEGEQLPRASSVTWLNGSEIPPLRKGFYATEIEKAKRSLGESVWEILEESSGDSEEEPEEEIMRKIRDSMVEARGTVLRAESLIERLGMNVADFPTENKKKDRTEDEGHVDGDDDVGHV